MLYNYYTGTNRVRRIDDFGGTARGFDENGATLSDIYRYDANGNLIEDPYKGIDIDYNHLNLPTLITKGSETLEILYSADGTKLQQIKKTGSTVDRTRDYLGGIEYLDTDLDAIYHSEGRLFYGGASTPEYEYHLRDHLGNTRITFADLDDDGVIEETAGEIIQESHYYAFGLAIDGPWTTPAAGAEERYRYNGKELVEDLGLGWYDYGARWYDPAIGRWNAVDPLADKMPNWSPYNYTFNNPLSFIDPDGSIPWPIQVRSFISANRVSGYFRGDGRRPNARANTPRNTSRVRSSFTADPSTGNVSNVSATSDPTVFYAGDLIFSKRIRNRASELMPVVARSGDPSVSVSNVEGGNGQVSFDFSHEGRDPLTPPGVTPDLDVNGSFSLTENLESGTLTVAAELTGDLFPSAELLIGDQSGNNLLLGTHLEKGGLEQLFGENNNGLISVNLTINFDNDGNFTSVNSNGNTYSVEEWNRLVQRNSR